MVIQSRIVKFFKKNNNVSESQIAFKKGNRTSDHIFILKSHVDEYINKDQSLYTCFVDFRKAFDKVNHLKVLYKKANRHWIMSI